MKLANFAVIDPCLIFLFLASMLFPFWCAAGTETVAIKIHDSAAYHVHLPEQYFRISLDVESPPGAKLRYYWKDFRGNPLTRPVELTLPYASIRSPSGKIGYYDLVLTAGVGGLALPNRESGEERSYGFAILPRARISGHRPDPESRFGVVHANVEDPYMPAWVKTMTWNTTGAKWWAQEMKKRRNFGKQELPIISSSDWDSDDSVPILSAHLEKLKLRVKAYFSADPSIQFWETGIEENLKSRYRERYYWENLERKLEVVRNAANEVNPDIRLIYQIAGLKQKAISNFAHSRASRFIDILSVHPYAWPDFPSPETWHDKYLHGARQQLRTHGLTMPVWYTEVGATHQGNIPGAFFGYPKKNAEVEGLSPYQAVLYIIKLHVMALHAGIGKIFWYNYQDRHPEREFAENHFGLRDYWGFPKPVYAAYIHLTRILAHKAAVRRRDLKGNVRVYEFSDDKSRVFVIWSFPAPTAGVSLPLASLIPGLSTEQGFEIVDPMGSKLNYTAGSVTVTDEPVFVTINVN